MIRPVQAMVRPLLVRNLAAKVPKAAGESICRFAAGPRGALRGKRDRIMGPFQGLFPMNFRVQIENIFIKNDCDL